MADFVLRVLEGTTPGTELVIEDELLLGRSAGRSGNLGGDATLSRRHARIQRTAQGLQLEDLGSHNGTLLNGAAIVAPVVLAAGDRIEVGETTLELIAVDAPAPVEADPGRTRVSHRIVEPEPAPDPSPGAPEPPAAPAAPPRAQDQPTRLGEVPVVVGGDQPTRLGEVPVLPARPADQPTRLGEVPVVVGGDQPTRLGEVPVVGEDQPTRLGEVPVVVGGDQPTRLGEVPAAPGAAIQPPAASPQAPPAEPAGEDEAREPGRSPWWRRLFGGSR